MCLYAFEFSRSQNEFSEFYSRFLRFMGENEQILQQSLSLNGIANASIAYASLGLTNDDYASFWDSVRTGAESSLLHDREPLESSKPIEMILGALTLVDSQEMVDEKQSEERRETNSKLVKAILSRSEELLALPYTTTSLFFACLTRFFVQMDEG